MMIEMNCYVRLGSLSVRSSRSGSRLAARTIVPVSSVQVFGNRISREREREKASLKVCIYLKSITLAYVSLETRSALGTSHARTNTLTLCLSLAVQARIE
jgi:hypothetical protein